ncbi:MAG: twin-arginine translocase TatA/TatE family subunit [Actinobacteria bacterium]|nr:MAG: twin-arginine translocase TatA/TatE family subunit [Actinomycetota bacterium]
MLGLGPQELFLILLIALLIFGPKKLPELARSIGKAINSFNQTSKKILKDVQSYAEEDTKDDKPKSQSPS